MTQPYVGEIRMFGGSFAPAGWAYCDGSLMPIAENETLFNLIGTTYGGDGQETFALPDLRGRVPVHRGGRDGLNYLPGERGGVESVTLSVGQLPAHSHLVSASSATPPPTGGGVNVTGGVPYVPGSNALKPKLYAPPGATVPMAPGAVAASGAGQPHDNMAPYLTINFIISLFGIFPSPT